MDYQTIQTFITSVGFPIAMCVIMFLFLMKETDMHREESSAMKEAINDLRMAITSLIDKIDNS